MDTDELAAVAEAFSRKAQVYDAFGRDHPHLMWMRQQVREHVLRYLRPGERILEINAGTGADAVFFASQGWQVHASDVSPGMVAEMERKAAANPFAGRLSVQTCSFTQLDQIHGAPYDYLFSNMGGVNCLSDLSQISRHLPYALRPGSRLTWVVMPPVCPWELMQALRGHLRHALRRLRPGGVIANVEGVPVATYYHSPRKVLRALGADFRLRQLQGLAVFTPTADHKDFAFRHARLYARLQKLDQALAGRPPFNAWGDFYLLTAEYQPR